MASIKQALAIVEQIIAESKKHLEVIGFKFRIYLYGSVSMCGGGNDIDLIIEVPWKAFEEYKATCMLSLDGVLPYSDQLVAHFYSLHWDYFSPREARSKEALRTIKVEMDSLAHLLDGASLDVVCLPKGWNEKKSRAFQKLSAEFSHTIDPSFLDNASRMAKQVFPTL